MAIVLETAAQYDLAKVQQLRDAQELLAHPTADAFGTDAHDRHLAGAMYLAGYAVECVLKAYIIRKYGVPSHGVTPPTGRDVRLDEVLPAVRAATAINLAPRLHSLHDLWQAAAFPAVPVATTADLSVCSPWQVDWRYQPGSTPARLEAEEFVGAAERVVHWVDAQP
jgi:hypothetical protein